MRVEEFLIGFDIRHPHDDMELADKLARDYPYVEQPRSLDTSVWPSVFREPLPSEFPADPLKTAFHEPKYISPDGRVPVYDLYSKKFMYCELWENLGSMLMRYPYEFGDEEVAAFTVFRFDEPVIYAYGDINFYDRVNIFESTLWNTHYEFYKDLVVPSKLKPSEWKFLGYEAIADSSILNDDPEYLRNIGITHKKNSYGLINDFKKALYECIICNDKDREHDAYLIFGVYQAVDRENISFVNDKT